MKKLTIILSILLFALPAKAQVCKEISIKEYLEMVRKSNLEYAAQRLSIDYA